MCRGLKVLAPGTVEDARHMLAPGARRPGPPVVIFEHVMLYNMKGRLAADAGPVDISARRRPAARVGT